MTPRLEFYTNTGRVLVSEGVLAAHTTVSELVVALQTNRLNVRVVPTSTTRTAPLKTKPKPRKND